MSNSLIKYEAARYALQVASKVDEVKDIRDKALAMAAYARQANDDELIKWATDIKLRAERRCGEMLAETERNNGSKFTAVDQHDRRRPTLEEIGITKQQSSDFQVLADIPEETFEKELATGKATTKSLVRKAKKPKAEQAKAKPAPEQNKEPEPRGLLDELESSGREISKLTALVESLKKTDLGAEIENWSLKFDQLEGRLNQEITTRSTAEKQAKYGTNLLEKIRKALHVSKNGEILPAIEACKCKKR
jgi:hypothetical protein